MSSSERSVSVCILCSVLAGSFCFQYPVFLLIMLPSLESGAATRMGRMRYPIDMFPNIDDETFYPIRNISVVRFFYTLTLRCI